MKKARKKARKKKTVVGQSIIESLKEISAWQRGEIKLRVTEVQDPIPPVRIKAIRKKAAKSVRIFRAVRPAGQDRTAMGARCAPARRRKLAIAGVIDSNPDVVVAAAKRRKRAA